MSFPFKTLGVEVKFPFEPYGVQKAMMNRLTSTLMNKEHCLIESPTGTGKTLVLLCATLAWQNRSKAIGQPFISAKLRRQKTEERRDKLMNRACTCGRRQNIHEDDVSMKKLKTGHPEKAKYDQAGKVIDRFQDDNEVQETKLKASPYFQKEPKSECINLDSDDDDVQIIDDQPKNVFLPFANIKPKTETPAPGPVNNKPKIEMPTSENDHKVACTDTLEHVSNENDKPLCKTCVAIQVEERFTEVLGEDSLDGEDFVTGKIKSKIPRIYYGTRTHKQITQVVRELNKTSYNQKLKMCILSSRERTCINNDVKDLPSRNDKCQELIKNKQNSNANKNKLDNNEICSYYLDSNTVSALFEGINQEFETEAWDIEDATSFGKTIGCCPYYGARSLQESADITFCPYNYLLDPTIRKTLNVNLNNAIVVFDEAHNIEDICRDSASFIIDTKQIDDILETIKIASSHYLQGSNIMEAYNFFRDKFLGLKGYLTSYDFDGNVDQDKSDHTTRRILSQAEMTHDLALLRLGPDCLQQVKQNLSALRGDDDDDKSKSSSDTQQPALNFQQMQFITQLCMTLEFMYSSNNKFLHDFRTVVSKSLDRNTNRFTQRPNNRQNNNHNNDPYVWQFSLLCMNSGIAFDKIQSLAWSVVVASGTLSPIESLKSELGCTFSNVFEGAHVIKEDRIFATVLSRGPQRVDLNCAYGNSLKLEFQDEVGTIIRDVCKNVPNGVLCFFPSYDRMETFYQRWFSKGIIREIEKFGKKLFRERKNLSASEFEVELEKYNNHAKKKGALLFAVFRGKVSEGIDFADKAARAVITIGIPYPNIKEVTIGLKKDYNDEARSKRPHLMSGRDWYSSQAFRALNQALGRCIRHQQDWGAIIMIDSRLTFSSNQLSISKWLRKLIDPQSDYNIIKDKLDDFIGRLNLGV